MHNTCIFSVHQWHIENLIYSSSCVCICMCVCVCLQELDFILLDVLLLLCACVFIDLYLMMKNFHDCELDCIPVFLCSHASEQINLFMRNINSHTRIYISKAFARIIFIDFIVSDHLTPPTHPTCMYTIVHIIKKTNLKFIAECFSIAHKVFFPRNFYIKLKKF